MDTSQLNNTNKNTLKKILGMRKIQGRIFNVVYPTKIQKKRTREYTESLNTSVIIEFYIILRGLLTHDVSGCVRQKRYQNSMSC